VNIDDCSYVDCGNYGNCVDGASPTGIHLDDYTCSCDSGYEITLEDSMIKQGEETKKCTNINDCPLPLDENCGGLTDDTLRRGGCVDLIIDYDCLCQSGYEVTVLVAPPGNKTCTPKVCGIAPQLGHMETDLEGEEVNYDTPAWEYNCDAGYSLDGHANGRKSFSMRCTSAATFTAAKVCKPVTCGSPPIVRYSDESPEVDEFFYPDRITYSCEEGYSTDAQADGPISFQVRCQDDGTKTEVERCRNIECGVAPHHDHASWDSEKVFVYREKAKIECNDGFSLDESMSPKARWYALACLSDGTWGQTQDCQHVKCGQPPQVVHTTVTFDNQYYEDEVEYTLNTGYTLNGQHNGDSTFIVSCKDDATFSATRDPKPVECGTAPPGRKQQQGQANIHTMRRLSTLVSQGTPQMVWLPAQRLSSWSVRRLASLMVWQVVFPWSVVPLMFLRTQSRSTTMQARGIQSSSTVSIPHSSVCLAGQRMEFLTAAHCTVKPIVCLMVLSNIQLRA